MGDKLFRLFVLNNCIRVSDYIVHRLFGVFRILLYINLRFLSTTCTILSCNSIISGGNKHTLRACERISVFFRTESWAGPGNEATGSIRHLKLSKCKWMADKLLRLKGLAVQYQ